MASSANDNATSETDSRGNPSPTFTSASSRLIRTRVVNIPLTTALSRLARHGMHQRPSPTRPTGRATDSAKPKQHAHAGDPGVYRHAYDDGFFHWNPTLTAFQKPALAKNVRNQPKLKKNCRPIRPLNTRQISRTQTPNSSWTTFELASKTQTYRKLQNLLGYMGFCLFTAANPINFFQCKVLKIYQFLSRWYVDEAQLLLLISNQLSINLSINRKWHWKQLLQDPKESQL